ncbi:MAG TPA: ATP-binding protein [Christiangramia sp.]|nr:ATP-binding protein [Christiangramia sp.]
MNKNLQAIVDKIENVSCFKSEEKAMILDLIKKTDKELTISEFKLERTEKVKRTTTILLEETIEELELKRKIVEDSREELQRSLEELKLTQDQLVQQEKLASLGQLTAGIAHEIKNPLNFVNNFSELCLEYIEEIKVEFEKLEKTEAAEEIQDLIKDVEMNLKRINQHGLRADGIVKTMLMHSRGGTGIMKPADLNELIKEYLNLAFHGMRAGSNPINVKIELNLDEQLSPAIINAEDFSRVILNLCKNAFDAMYEKTQKDMDYQPELRIKTYEEKEFIHLQFIDNGPGIPEENKDKILQPFFTTKMGTEGTGLGLSITNDIISAHKGQMQVLSEANSFTQFNISIPK